MLLVGMDIHMAQADIHTNSQRKKPRGNIRGAFSFIFLGGRNL
jgi:hypothetical protein